MLELNKDNFKKEVLESAVPVLVDFFATWCGPCKMMLPIVEELAKEEGGKFKIAKINVDESNDLAQEYEVMSIPTFIVFKNGKEVERVMGAQAKEKLLELLK
ncbi:MAG: thioredoxin [Patescibacteria group bacterium]